MVFEVDGSILEGGGQIFRMCVAMSVICKIPIRIFNIRANRKKSGLAAQHLNSIRFAKEFSQGHLENDEIGSTDVTFIPASSRSGKFEIDIPTGGSVVLLCQVALPSMLFGSGKSLLTIKGGTNADLAPSVDYFINVFKPILQKFGADFNCDVIRRGFIQGNGMVNISVNPVKKLSPINLTDFGKLESIEGEAFVAGVLPFKMADEMAKAAEKKLKDYLKVKIAVKPRKFTSQEAFGNGAGIHLFARTTSGCHLGSSIIGKRGVSSEHVGFESAELLLESINKKVCADSKLQDQLILYMALAEGKSKIKVGPITSHTETAIYISELLTKAKFNIVKLDDNTNIIECDGVGQINNLEW